MRTLLLKATVLALAVCTVAPSVQARTICTAVADAASGKVLSAEGDCRGRVTPASTFKIAISLMGYDAGVLRDAHSPRMAFREGYAAWRPEWRQDADPTDWMAKSVVWYSQQATTALGEARFGRYVRDFRYGDGDVSGGLTKAWLSSSLKISPLEQLDFLGRLVRRELPVSSHAIAMTEEITALPGAVDGWSVHGKTGSGAPRTPDGKYDQDHEYGWFVGWARRGERSVVFAHLIQNEKAQEAAVGVRARREFLATAPALLGR